MQLSDFLAPMDEATFRANYLGRRPLHIPREKQLGPDIFDWKRLNDALAITPYWNEDSLKLFFNTRAALRENYCDVSEGRGRAAPIVPAKVKAFIGLGASLVANHIHKVSPSVMRVVDMLEATFAARCFANVYCSFKGVQAFQTHYDLHDVFAYQAEGEKTWRVYESRAEAPINPVPPGEESEKWLIQTRGRVLFEVSMKPGDILYLPRGQYHDALTDTAKASLHVTFGVQPATGLSLFRMLETLLVRDRAFREYLPDARDPSLLQPRLEVLANHLAAVMTSRSFVDDVRNLQRGLATAQPADYALPEQRPAKWYGVETVARVSAGPSGYVVSHQGAEIAVGDLYPLADWMLQQRRFTLEDAQARLHGVAPEAIADLVEKMLQAGILAEIEMR